MQSYAFPMKIQKFSYEIGCMEVWSFNLGNFFSWERTIGGEKLRNEVINDLNKDIYLECPEKIKKINSWPAGKFYSSIVLKCFVKDEHKRADFSEIIKIISSVLNKEEQKSYLDVSNLYETRRNLLLDDEIWEKLRNQIKSDRRTVCATKSNSSVLSCDSTENETI